MNLKTSIIVITCTIIITAAAVCFITQRTTVYDPLDDPEIQKIIRETELKDSLNNEIIEVLQERINDKQFVIENILLKEVEESKSKVREYYIRKDSESKYIKSLDEYHLEKDINSKLRKRKN
ncbi:MAG: hypothetical protein EHM58_00555 [Ignavibacteriae bacterium]|nr:MAG: hypothetical protein EHM58_00555 [Ignavibacteriota bacterium]